MSCWLYERGQEPQDDPGETDNVRNNTVIQIDEAHYHEGCNEDEVDEKDGEEGHHRFNQWIPWRYRGLTRSALPAEQKIAEDGDIIIGLNGCLALRAAGKWRDKGCFRRNPEDTDVEKASHNSPEEEGKGVKENGVHRSPPSICHGQPSTVISVPVLSL